MSSEQTRGRAPQGLDESLDHASNAGAPGADDAAVRSVDRAAALLVCVADADGSASVTDLSHSLDLHKSTVSRLLSTLERRGLVEQDRDSGHFRLGVGIIRLAQSAERTLDLRAIALPEMEALAKATHETVSLEVFDGVAAAVAICQIDGPNLTPMPDITGRPVAMHAIASGKVLLASLPERTVLSIARRGLVRYTSRTITDPRALLSKISPPFGIAGMPWRLASGTSALPPPQCRSVTHVAPSSPLLLCGAPLRASLQARCPLSSQRHAMPRSRSAPSWAGAATSVEPASCRS